MTLAKGENAADARRQKSGIKRDRDKVGSGEVRMALSPHERSFHEAPN